MKMSTISAMCSSEKTRLLPAICLMLLCCLSAGCAKRVEYVSNDHRLTRVAQGQSAPRSGVLMSEGYLSEIYEALGQSKPAIESASAVKTAPPPTASIPPIIEKDNGAAPKR